MECRSLRGPGPGDPQDGRRRGGAAAGGHCDGAGGTSWPGDPAGRRSVHPVRDQRPGGRGPAYGRIPQHPSDFGAHAARLRRVDRGRGAGPARRHRGRREHGAGRADLLSRACRAHRQFDDRAGRDGGRGRLLALLSQARAGGTREGRVHRRRRRDRRPDLRPRHPRLRGCGHRVDGQSLSGRRRHLQLPGHRRHRRGRGRRARLDHRATGPAGQARHMGRSATDSVAMAHDSRNAARCGQQQTHRSGAAASRGRAPRGAGGDGGPGRARPGYARARRQFGDLAGRYPRGGDGEAHCRGVPQPRNQRRGGGPCRRAGPAPGGGRAHRAGQGGRADAIRRGGECRRDPHLSRPHGHPVGPTNPLR